MALMMHPVLVVADAEMRPLREIADYELDMAFGADENDFELSCRDGWEPPAGGWVWIDGTEYGGTVDSRSATTSRGADRTVTVSGRTWHGILAGKVVVADAGQSHLTVSGPAQQVLRALISRHGLDAVFSAPDSEGSGSVTYTFDRFTDLYTGIRKMLSSAGLRLSVKRSGGTTLLGAVPATSHAGLDSDAADFTVTRTGRRVNHLVCAGKGEDEARAVVHLYADANGKVSRAQSLFGADEIAALYDYSNADESTLIADGTKKLSEMQAQGSVDMTAHSDIDAAVGDVIAARDNEDGTEVSAEVVKKIVKVKRGVATYSYEVGSAATTGQGGLTGRAESSGGGAAYTAGDGIRIAGGVISAEVTSASLAAVSGTASSARKEASDALAAAGSAREAADAAQSTADAKLAPGGVTADLPLKAEADGVTVKVSHGKVPEDPDQISAVFGPTDDFTLRWGGSVTVPGIAVDAYGHVMTGRDSTLTLSSSTATSSAPGLMSASDKAKLDGVATGANRYAHPSYTSRATGLYKVAVDALGHVYAATAVSKTDITALGIPGSDTTYATATASSAGLMSAADKSKLNGVSFGANNYTLPVATSARLGGVKPDGSTITVGSDGTITARVAAATPSHPVGTIIRNSTGRNPSRDGLAGTWAEVPSLDGFAWRRTG